MFSVWRLLPVCVTQFSQAVVVHKSLLSPTFLGSVSSLPPPPPPHPCEVFPTFCGSCVPAINNWAFHSCHLGSQEPMRGWNELEMRRVEISKRKRKKENKFWWRKWGSFCAVSVECAVCSLVSSARKVQKREGGRRGQKNPKKLSAHQLWVWISESAWEQVRLYFLLAKRKQTF